ncbi:MAG: L,D-transpeptidase [Solirubrobacterales bacterium]
MTTRYRHPRRRRTRSFLRTALLPLLALAAALVAFGSDPEPVPTDPVRVKRPAKPAAPTTTGERLRLLSADGHHTPVARVLRRALLRRTPGGSRLGIAGTKTEFGSRRILPVVDHKGPWLGVLATERRGGKVAWIHERKVKLSAIAFSATVDASARRLTIRHDGRIIRTLPVAVGAPASPTPLGTFAVTDKITMNPGSPYGCCAIALSGHQPQVPQGWGGGDRLAIHGTQFPGSIGQAASLGCMRATPGQLQKLMGTLPLGTPVVVRA